jgi:hypothetical protein
MIRTIGLLRLVSLIFLLIVIARALNCIKLLCLEKMNRLICDASKELFSGIGVELDRVFGVGDNGENHMEYMSKVGR